MNGVRYECTVRHTRSTPARFTFAYRMNLWFVDLDDLPQPPAWLRWAARFEARDHLGDPSSSIRANVERYLRRRGIELHSGRVTMLTQPRTLGYVFNPLTVYWCHNPDGQVVATLAEVHNTYGERHCYLIRPGQIRTDKTFPVSPFFDVTGSYTVRLPEPGKKLALTVALDRDGERPFVASVTGTVGPVTTAGLIRHPLGTLAVSARIRTQGIRLWLRRLPVTVRGPHQLQEDV